MGRYDYGYAMKIILEDEGHYIDHINIIAEYGPMIWDIIQREAQDYIE